jgi:TrmH family RNA methyltransferase
MLGASNQRVQRLRRLLGRRSARRDDGAFVVEGEVVLAEALTAGWEVEEVYVAAGHDLALELPPGIRVQELAPGVVERVASTDSPQPVLAVVAQRHPVLSELTSPTFVVVCVGVADPGNAGTIVRSAEAAGADAVVLTPGSVDVYNPKVVRASAGALFHLPVVSEVGLEAVRELGLTTLGTSSHRGSAHTATDLTRPIALVLGNEAHGLAGGSAIDEWVTITHAGRAESLNVAMAATVLCFEVARQRGA